MGGRVHREKAWWARFSENLLSCPSIRDGPVAVAAWIAQFLALTFGSLGIAFFSTSVFSDEYSYLQEAAVYQMTVGMPSSCILILAAFYLRLSQRYVGLAALVRQAAGVGLFAFGVFGLRLQVDIWLATI